MEVQREEIVDREIEEILSDIVGAAVNLVLEEESGNSVETVAVVEEMEVVLGQEKESEMEVDCEKESDKAKEVVVVGREEAEVNKTVKEVESGDGKQPGEKGPVEKPKK